jgi:hypothetical protein
MAPSTRRGHFTYYRSMPDEVYSLVVTFTGDDRAALQKIAEQAVLLCKAVLPQFDGFLGATVMCGSDGDRLLIVTDWGSRETLVAAQLDPQITAVVSQHLEASQTVDVHIYERYAAVTAAPR